MGVCNCSMFCCTCTLLYGHSSVAIILTRKRELVALLSLSSWCLVMVVWFFLAVQWACLRFLIVVFPDHTHLLFFDPAVNFLMLHSTELLIKTSMVKKKATSCFKPIRYDIYSANKCKNTNNCY